MIYKFGPYKLDARERVVRRNGELLRLTPKLFDILLVLVQHSGRVLTKNELIERVWPDMAVEESNLARQISTLRQALSDRAGRNQYIQTVPWRGYRFTARVERADEQAPPIDSIAVLPFANESGDPEREYLSDGITETLINRLSLLSDLKVMSWNTVLRYKLSRANDLFPEASVVGRTLHVRAVITGRVRQSAQTVIVSAELIDGIDNRQLWGAQYRRELSDVFSLQEAISHEIVEHLRLRLSSQDKRHLAKQATQNSEAYDLYLRGRFFLNKLTMDGVRKALEFFQQAAAKDPRFALAYAGLIDCYIGLNNPIEAKKAAMKALELNPALGEAHASLGFLTFLYDWDWKKAEAELRRGIRLNPNYAQARQWYALFLAKNGRHEEAAVEARRAQQLDPHSMPMNLTRGVLLCFARQYDRAIEELRQVVAMDTNFAAAHSTLGLAYMYRKMCSEAIAEFETTSALTRRSPEMETPLKALMAGCYAICGKKREARRFLREVKSKPDVSPYAIATVHAHLGEHSIAIDWLERACRERNFQVLWMKVDPGLDPLRSSRRFKNLLSQVGLS